MAFLIGKLKIIQAGRENRELILTHEPLTIGHQDKNLLVLEDPEVFPFHVEIIWKGDHYAISPRKMRAPIWINGKEVFLQTDLPLAHDDVIRIGEAEIHFFEQTDVALSSEPDSRLLRTVVTQATNTHALRVTTSEGIQNFPLRKPSLILGRSPQCDIVIDFPVVSKRHAQLTWNNNTYIIEDLGSTNGLTFAEKRIARKRLENGDQISIWDDVTLTYHVIPKTDGLDPIETLNLRDRNLVMLGRDSRNDIVIDHPVASRFHAKIELEKGSWVITDLNSSSGTFVNGQQVLQQRILRPGDTIRIAPCSFVFNFDETLIKQSEVGNLRLDALHLKQLAGKNITILDDVSLSILPKEFVAVVGVSGAGKSTLLGALNGFCPPTQGTVFVNAHNLYKHFDAYRTDLGYVPQDDIIHRELSVVQALDFAARLRLPADVSSMERRRQVQEVLKDLELTRSKHVIVKNLSGGQRKRVSIGVELLTKPSLFFLDEATSGLDPGTETQMMRLLRRLADQGRTIVLITHATKNVMLCDLVVFLAKGGRIAFVGPPAEALTYFGVQDFDEIYLKIEGERSPQEWQHRYQQSPYYQKFVVDRQQTLSLSIQGEEGPSARTRPPRASKQGVSAWRQLWILSQRNLTILLQDRASLILMLALAPILGILDFVLWKRSILDPSRGDPGQSFTMLFVSVFIAVIVGSLASMREIVKEAEIYQRERMIGLKIWPYILSKVLFCVVLALYQSAIFLMTKVLSVDLPLTLQSGLEMYFTLFLATLGGMMMGLLVSALAPTQSVAPLLTILFLVPQITFAGAILPLNSLGPAGQLMSQLTVSRWAYQTMVTLAEVGQDVAHDACWQQPDSVRKTWGEKEKASCQCLGPNLFKKCHFPGIWQEYDSAVDQSEPIKPKEPGASPIAPTNPLSRSAKNYVGNIKAYNAKVIAYQKDLKTWQDTFSRWKEHRGKAIASAEALLSRYKKNQGAGFAVNVYTHWASLGWIMLGTLGLIIILQKRKDVI
jgi:ABC transport system ATP-binding/permease protein